MSENEKVKYLWEMKIQSHKFKELSRRDIVVLIKDVQYHALLTPVLFRKTMRRWTNIRSKLGIEEDLDLQ